MSGNPDDVKPDPVELGEHEIVAGSPNNLPLPERLAVLSPDELRKLARWATLKMDLNVMPIVVIMYILNYLDRQNIASAKLAGLEEDLGLTEVEYQTCVSILFVGYILMQVPSNMILGKITWPGIYICAGMGTWGAISACMGSVQDFAGLVTTRFFIGFVEAVFYPGAIYYISLFYNKQQLAFRTAILYSGSQLGNAFGGLFAIGIMELEGTHGIAGWRWLFIVEGVLTLGLAILFAFLLPNSNASILGMSDIETEYIQWNYLSGNTATQQSDAEVTAWKGLVMAVTDIKTWMIMGILGCTYIAGSVTNFFPSVVGGLGYDRNTTYLLTAPPFCLAVIAMWLNGWNSDRTQERWLHIISLLFVCLVAHVIAVSTTEIAPRYVAIMLMPTGIYASTVVTQSWVTNTLNQPQAKRAAAIALINAICNTPNIWCSYLYHGPRYILAFTVNIVATGVAIAIATITHFYLRRLNQKLDRGEDLGKHGPTPAQIDAGFRYII